MMGCSGDSDGADDLVDDSGVIACSGVAILVTVVVVMV